MAALTVVLGPTACAAQQAARVGDLGPGIPQARPLSAYHVTYRVEEATLTYHEGLLVRRPFSSRRTSSVAGTTTTGLLSNPDGLWQWVAEPDRGWQLIDPGLHIAAADARPLAFLELVLEQGLAELHGEDEILGRGCLVVRIASPVGEPVASGPTDDDYDELCIEEHGIPLRETSVMNGQHMRTAEAVHLDVDPAIPEDAFDPTPALASEQRALVRELVRPPAHVLETLDVVVEPPADVEVEQAVGWLQRDAGGAVVSGSLRRVFRRGPDAVEVEEVAGVTGPGLAFPTPLGEGYLRTDLRHATLRVPVREGVVVTLRGSDMRLLGDIAASMRLREER